MTVEYGIYGQYVDASGAAVGSEFRVNTTATGIQFEPAVAANASATSVVAWTSDGQDGSGYGIYAQRYNSTPAAVGNEFRVSTYWLNNQSEPSVAMDASGNFVVTWTSFGQDLDHEGIFGQLYNANGSLNGSEFQVNTTWVGYQWGSSVAMDGAGNFVVVWHETTLDAFGYGVAGQRYNANGVPQGSEFQVNTQMLNDQALPSVAMDASGDFVVAWTSYLQDSSGYGIYGQRYDAAGAAQGNEFRVNSNTTYDQTRPSVGMDAYGNFVIAWDSYFQDSDELGVYAQRYDASGSRLGNEFQVNTNVVMDQDTPSVGMGASGDVVIAWHSYPQDNATYGVYAQRYDFAPPTIEISEPSTSAALYGPVTYTVTYSGATSVTLGNTDLTLNTTGDAAGDWNVVGSGDTWYVNVSNLSGEGTLGISINADTASDSLGNMALAAGPSTPFLFGEEFQVNTEAANYQQTPAVATDESGNFVAVWRSSGQDSSSGGIYAQRYNASGIAQGSEFRVNSTTSGEQTEPSVAMDPSGNFVIVWRSDGQDGSYGGIYAQRYNASGIVQGSEFRVNTETSDDQFSPSVAMDSSGNFVVVWASDYLGYSVLAQRYNAAGAAQGSEFRVDNYTYSGEYGPSAAMDSTGDFVVVWEGYDADTASNEVYGRRYNAAGTAQGSAFQANTYKTAAQENPSVAMDSSGNFVVAWMSYGQDGGSDGVFGQRYDAEGVAQGLEFQVNSYATATQNKPSVAMDTSGYFAVTWTSYGPDGHFNGVFGQRFDPEGLA